MGIIALGMDLAKHIFHVRGVSAGSTAGSAAAWASGDETASVSRGLNGLSASPPFALKLLRL